MRKPLSMITGLLIVVCAQAQKINFRIAGTVTGYPDSTIMYLEDCTTSGGTAIDSTLVLNNQFHFSGTIITPAIRAMLRTKNYSDYKFFWLEKNAMTFTAGKGKFREAVITGSQTQDEQYRLDTAIKAAGKDREVYLTFIREHPQSIISAHLLHVYASTWGKDTVIILYHSLSDAMRNTLYGKNVYDYLTLNKNIRIGDRFADFTQTDMEGKPVSLSDFAGKVVLLEFWGSWCGPCRKGHPELVGIYNEFREKGFEILGVAADEKKEYWLSAIKEDSLPWKNVSDLKGDQNRAALIYGISYYPASYLIDKSGIVIARDLKGEALRTRLNELFNKQ